jgi:acetyl-CoA synthase
MSKLICSSAIAGAMQWVTKAEVKLDQAILEKGSTCPIAFPDSAYYLPIIYSFTGQKAETLSDLRTILNTAKEYLPEQPSDQVWLPYLGNTLDAGVAALFACEIIEACKYCIGPHPVEGIWLGAASDLIMRERGIEFVDGTAPGFAAITGAAPNSRIAVKIARELQEKNLYVFMAGSLNGVQFADQLAEEGVQLGWETRLVPFGKEVSALVYALGFANRAALSFGGVKPGDFAKNLKYNKNRIFAFVLALGEVTPDKYAAAAGAINYGFPVISDTDIPEILPTGICTYEHVVSNIAYDNMVEKALEVRGCKVKITKVPIPVSYGPAFEGERIRKIDAQAEFGGNKTMAFEFVTSRELDEINDGEINIIGPDIDQVNPGDLLPLAIWVEVAGRKMQTDFEPILERQIHHLINGAEGIWHMGQRDIVWTRVSKEGFNKGLRLKHYGEIIHAKFLSDYPAIVDKVKVTMITDEAQVRERIVLARKVYDERNRRMESMTDDSVDTFYSCLLCQSFAPNHVCIITPERLGLCGAYNWLDGKAAYEIDETGPNKPIKKNECLDPVRGIWQGVDEYVHINSHKTLHSFSAYSIMHNPMTSCGCFEVICAYLPECNGIMVVNREYMGETPVGMTFSSLAGNVGGGLQTPGFMGCGKVFLTSKKFLFAEGGHKRLVWMTKDLKNLLSDDLKKRFAEQNIPDLLEQIADETIAIEPHQVLEYLRQVGHPALVMEDMSSYAGTETEQVATAPVSESKPVQVIENEKTEKRDITGEQFSQLKDQLKAELIQELRASITKEIVGEIVHVLHDKFSGHDVEKNRIADLSRLPSTTDHPPIQTRVDTIAPEAAAHRTPDPDKIIATVKPAPQASERLDQVTAFKIRKEKCENPVWQVQLGATAAEGGTRRITYKIGGETCMPFHLWEGEMPNPPLVAMEVFDVVSEKYPEVLRRIYGDLLHNPVAMAQACVEKYGADLISVRLDGTHPERGNRTASQAVQLVKEVLNAVDVPLIITGHNSFDKNNEVLKAIAQACAGEKLLLNWVEQDNYRTLAGSAMAYGHSLISQSPIDVNIAKQMNILLTNMDIKPEQIVMDPMTGATGYGIENTYSVKERIRMTALNGDKMLAGPLIVSPGQECAKIKEFKALEKDFPAWGDLEKRAALWELATSVNLLYAGADILILYHPQAVSGVKSTISQLLGNSSRMEDK